MIRDDEGGGEIDSDIEAELLSGDNAPLVVLLERSLGLSVGMKADKLVDILLSAKEAEKLEPLKSLHFHD